MMDETKCVFGSFFVFGLLNNILYVVILSAAIDLVGASTPKAVVLVADIAPSFAIKLSAPFFIHKIAYKARIWLLVALSGFGMLIIGLSGTKLIGARILGICMASLSSGLGELTFLQLTHFYQRQYSISGFSSGTGAAGLVGSFIFMLFTNVFGIPTKLVLILFSLAPLGFIVSFYVFLPRLSLLEGVYIPLDEGAPSLDDYSSSGANETSDLSILGHIRMTLRKMTPLVTPYMLPLTLVYISEYIINQGISPTLLFLLDTLPHWLFTSYRDIYVVYGFVYQFGVFLSRSSTVFNIRIKRLYLLAVLQLLNVFITLCQSFYDYPFLQIWPLLLLIFYEGFLGGFSYVNTFMSVSEEVPPHMREFCMGCVGISDTFGVLLAGLINWSLEPYLCHAQVARGRDWCLKGDSS